MTTALDFLASYLYCESNVMNSPTDGYYSWYADRWLRVMAFDEKYDFDANEKSCVFLLYRSRETNYETVKN